VGVEEMEISWAGESNRHCVGCCCVVVMGEGEGGEMSDGLIIGVLVKRKSGEALGTNLGPANMQVFRKTKNNIITKLGCSFVGILFYSEIVYSGSSCPSG